ncbi:MAG: hypothetical protein ACYDA1_05960 [Vulcanimicrobiaceae bacterium]
MMKTIASALVFCALFLAFSSYSARSASPTPSPSPTSSIHSQRKASESLSVNGKIALIDGFYFWTAPATPKPSPKPTATATPKPKPTPSPKPTAKPVTCIKEPDGSCSANFIRAKAFFKAIGVKVKGNPYTTYDKTGVGTVTVTYCKKDYKGKFIYNKDPKDGGKPNVDPIYFSHAMHFVSSITGGSTMMDPATYEILVKHMDPKKAAKLAENSFTVRIAVPIACKAKKHKKSGYRVTWDTTIDAVAHNGGHFHDVFSADITLQNTSGKIGKMKTPAKPTPKPTTNPYVHATPTPKPVSIKPKKKSQNLSARGSGTIIFESGTLSNGTCGEHNEYVASITQTTNGSMSLFLTGAKAPSALYFDIASANLPAETITCHGQSGTGPVGFGSLIAMHADEVSLVTGVPWGTMPIVAAIEMPLSPFGRGEYDADYNRTENVNGTTITESTHIVVMDCKVGC